MNTKFGVLQDSEIVSVFSHCSKWKYQTLLCCGFLTNILLTTVVERWPYDSDALTIELKETSKPKKQVAYEVSFELTMVMSKWEWSFSSWSLGVVCVQR